MYTTPWGKRRESHSFLTNKRDPCEKQNIVKIEQNLAGSRNSKFDLFHCPQRLNLHVYRWHIKAEHELFSSQDLSQSSRTAVTQAPSLWTTYLLHVLIY